MRDDLRTIVGLGPVHMNGRIYDPLLGRFLSADILVENPANLQAYNRYSYVRNNPLTLVDPTGWYSVLGLEFTDGGGVGGFFKDLGGYGGDVVMGAVGDNMVAGYHEGTEHMTAGFSEIANANGALDTTIGALHTVAAVGKAVGVVMEVLPSGKAEKAVTQGAEKLAVKAESTVANAVSKAEGKAATIEKRVEGVVAQDGSKVSKATPTAELKGGTKKETGSYTNHHESGKTYDGKGSKERSQTSARRVEKETGDKHVATEWTPAKDERGAFKDESKRLDSHGGAKSEGNHNKIESPGKKKRIEDGEL